jgi:hypothetical protein
MYNYIYIIIYTYHIHTKKKTSMEPKFRHPLRIHQGASTIEVGNGVGLVFSVNSFPVLPVGRLKPAYIRQLGSILGKHRDIIRKS